MAECSVFSEFVPFLLLFDYQEACHCCLVVACINDKTNVEPVHSYDAFHTRSDISGVKGIIGMHRFNICLVVLLLSCSGVKTPSPSSNGGKNSVNTILAQGRI